MTYNLITTGSDLATMKCVYVRLSIFFTHTASIKLSPRFGNMFGGTPILIDPGVTISATDEITCGFGGATASGMMLNSSLVLCVSPALEQTGLIEFSLDITGFSPQTASFLSSM